MGEIMDYYDETFEKALCAARGELVEGLAPDWVEGPGETYDRACEELWQARRDLCDRTGIDWEDIALERIVNALDTLEQDLARRMFHAGIAVARKENVKL